MMTQSFIDSASLYELPLALKRQSPGASFRMEWERSIEVTIAVITTDHLQLPPSPQAETAASGLYGLLIEGLSENLSQMRISGVQQELALKRAKRWGSERSAYLRDTVTSFSVAGNIDLEKSRWLQSHIENEWVEHTKRRGALFEPAFARQIAKAMSINADEMDRLFRMAANLSYIAEMTKKTNAIQDFEQIRDAFILGTLLRGRYYEELAKLTNSQFFTHPVRRPPLRTATARKMRVNITAFEKYLAQIILAASFAERKPEERLKLWLSNVAKLRKARHHISFDERLSEESSLNDAIHETRRFDVRAHSKALEACLDATISLAAFGIGELYLNFYENAALTLAMWQVNRGTNLAAKIASFGAARPARLRALANLPPGSIVQS